MRLATRLAWPAWHLTTFHDVDAAWMGLIRRQRMPPAQADSGEEREKSALGSALGAYWYLDYMAVDTGLQSRGLGTRALRQCLRQAQVGPACGALCTLGSPPALNTPREDPAESLRLSGSRQRLAGWRMSSERHACARACMLA